MKHTLLCCGATIAFSVLSSLNGFAKPLPAAGNFSKHTAFTENKGQIIDQYGKHRNDIDYKLDGGNVTMFVGDRQIHYQWYRSNKKEKSKNEKTGLPYDSKSPSGDLGVAVYRMDVVLLGANKNAEVLKEGLQEDYENYYLPQCPGGVTARRYSKITYKNIYPNIDWEIETAPLPSPKGEASSQGCKYNFIVHPGGDYKNIKIQYNGATSIALKDGALVAATPMGSITENMPYTYDAATHKEIKSNFILNNNILSYHIALPSGSGEGDRASAFIIDPVLKWGTYYGGPDNEYTPRIADDSAGNAYLYGSTQSTSNIATTGAYQTSFSGGTTYGDVYIAKFNTSGQLLWATYFGGSAEDAGADIACDRYGNVFITGFTNSTSGAGIATSGAFRTVPANAPNPTGFFAKFNGSGSRLWCSYFDGGLSFITADNIGDIYIIGHSQSTTGITTPGTHLSTVPAGGTFGFIVKFTTNGSRIWGTYYPGQLSAIDCDDIGNVFVGGYTSDTSGIATPGTFIPAITWGSFAGFIVDFNSSTGTRKWGTYLDVITPQMNVPTYFPTVAADRTGNVYGAGTTANPNNIATSGTYQPTMSGGADGYIIKFNTAGQRIWGTYCGSNGSEGIGGICVHNNGNVYVSGTTYSLSGMATPGSYQTSLRGYNDAFIAVFDYNGNRQWASYYGGYQFDGAGGVSSSNFKTITCKNQKGAIYLCGGTTSNTNIATPGAYQTYYSGNGDAFLAQFEITDTQVFIRPPFYDTVLCSGDTMHVEIGVTKTFRPGNIFRVQLSNASGSFSSPVNLYNITTSNAASLKFVLPSLTAGNGYRIRVISTLPADTSLDNGINMRLSPYPTTSVATATTPVCAGQTLNLSSSNSSTGVVWSWIGPNSFTATTQNASIPNVQTNGTGDYIVTANLNGCKRKDTVSVTVNPSPAKPNATSNSPICSGQTLNLFATSTTGGVSWNWAGPGGFNTSAQNPPIPNAQTSNAGSYVVTATLGNCSSSDTEVVVINQGPAVNVYPSPNDTICQGGSVTLVALPISAGTGPTFQWYKNSNPIGGATNTSYSTTPNNGDVYYCRMTPGTGTSCTGAISSNSITMTVLPVTTPSVSISGPAGAQNPFNLLTFHATGTGGGSNPKYQWLRSGQLVQGAMADTWSTQGLYLSQHDTICVILTSSDICAVPKSDTACMVVNILTGVEDVNKNTTIQLYPNPNDGRFTIDAKGIANKEVTIEITNAVGQTVYTQKLNTTKGLLHETISTGNLSAGIYLLKLHDGDAVVTLRLVVSR